MGFNIVLAVAASRFPYNSWLCSWVSHALCRRVLTELQLISLKVIMFFGTQLWKMQTGFLMSLWLWLNSYCWMLLYAGTKYLVYCTWFCVIPAWQCPCSIKTGVYCTLHNAVSKTDFSEKIVLANVVLTLLPQALNASPAQCYLICNMLLLLFILQWCPRANREEFSLFHMWYIEYQTFTWGAHSRDCRGLRYRIRGVTNHPSLRLAKSQPVICPIIHSKPPVTRADTAVDTQSSSAAKGRKRRSANMLVALVDVLLRTLYCSFTLFQNRNEYVYTDTLKWEYV